MTLQQELLSIEEKLWSGGADVYERNLDSDCLVAFTRMSGVSSREEIAGSVEGPERWRDVSIEVEGLIEPLEGVALFTYRASAKRGTDESYRALVTSGYVRRDDGWKMMFHQQTPLADSAG